MNDTRGHVYGDRVLKRVGEIIRSSVRRIDHCGRYGGDEFLIVAPGADARGAKLIGERVRRAIEEAGIGVTASMGVVEFTGKESIEELVELLDKALYEAKKEGKNRVVVISPSLLKHQAL